MAAAVTTAGRTVDRRRLTRAAAALLAIGIAAGPAASRAGAQRADITVDYDKAYSFAHVATWAWHPDGKGNVRLALTPDDDPSQIASNIEPVIVPAVERELLAKKLRLIGDGPPDVYIRYVALVTTSQMEQFQGQFVAAVPAWGLPPFAPSTTALEVYPVGTLVIDVTTPAGDLVWRGAAKRKIDFQSTGDQRRKVLERAVRDVLRRFPPR